MLLWLFSATSPCFAEQVNLQLKWKHQFQFAGYYAALEQGYYRDEGLDVNIIPAKPGTNPDQAVLNHQAQYGVGTSNILLLRQQGEPVVVLAVILQHSAFAIATRADSSIRSVKDLRGKRLMQEYGSADIDALLQREAVLPQQYQAVPHSFDTADLISGHVDAMTVYKTDEVFELLQRGIPYRLFDPQLAGVNFYGDNLYTTEDELQQHPQRAKAFLRASLKGWQYAMAHIDEIIALIQQRYHSDKSHNALKFEADTMESLMVSGIIPPGYMYKNRWRDIVKTYQELGYLQSDFKLEPMLYQPTPSFTERLWTWRWYITAVIAVILILMLLLYTALLRHQISRRTTELRKSNQTLQSTFDHMQEVVFRTDMEGNILSVSPSAETLLGYKPTTFMKKNVANYYSVPEERAQLIAKIQAHGLVADYQICMKHRSGKPVWVSMNAHLSYAKDGSVTGLEGTIRNITDLKAAESALIQAHQKVEARDTNKGHVLEAISHDLRQPLQAMRLFIDALNMQKMNSSNQQVVGKIISTHDDISNIANKLLSVAHLNTGQVNINIENINLKTWLRRLHIQYVAQAEMQNIPLRLHLPQQRCIASTDTVLLTQLLNNLMMNALRYSGSNGVLLAIRPRSNCYRIEVRDTGKGIDSSDYDEIFTAYTQIRHSSNKPQEGAGLGLAICRRISDLLSLNLGVQSTKGRGTLFYVDVAKGDEAKHTHTTKFKQWQLPSFAHRSIMVVDHGQPSSEALHHLLQRWQCVVLSYADSEQAMTAIKDGMRPDVLITEYQLSGHITGIELAKRIRHLLKQPIPTLLLTEASNPEIEGLAASAGLPLLTQPFPSTKVHHFLHSHLGYNHPTGES